MNFSLSASEIVSERWRIASRSLSKTRASPMVEPPVPRPGMEIFRSTFALIRSDISFSVAVGDFDRACT